VVDKPTHSLRQQCHRRLLDRKKNGLHTPIQQQSSKCRGGKLSHERLDGESHSSFAHTPRLVRSDSVLPRVTGGFAP
jgi:hypothetical protein